MNARMKYVQAIFKDDKKNELLYLKEVIKHSKTLGEETKILEKDLALLEDEIADDSVFIKKEHPKETQKKFKVDSQIQLKQDYKPQEATLINGNNKVIVIDAGHGGKDPGAVGPNGEKEKEAVYDISRYLYAILKARGYKVYFTRDDDTFIELRDRTAFANKKDAKIFVSIHANAAPGEAAKRARGIETYFLSPAKDEKAKRVASLENGNDMSDMDSSGKNVFLDVFNRGKIMLSHKLAIDVQRATKYQASSMYDDILDGGVREAPFWVLVGAQSAAILVEVGYISHPQESQRLFLSSYQQKLAMGIADGINSYFQNNP